MLEAVNIVQTPSAPTDQYDQAGMSKAAAPPEDSAPQLRRTTHMDSTARCFDLSGPGKTAGMYATAAYNCVQDASFLSMHMCFDTGNSSLQLAVVR